MTGTDGTGTRIIGRLGSADGAGVVRIQDRYDTTPEDLWDALTDPARLARWYGQVDGDLRPGGRFRTYLEGSDIESTGRIEECDPPRRLRLTSRETDASYERGEGVPPYDGTIEVTLSPAGDRTDLLVEVRGMPVDKVAVYGAGWQMHAEHLADHLTGRDPDDPGARWGVLVPAYQGLAATLDR